MRLKDKSALITAAASGIGNDHRAPVCTEGAKVVLADLDRNAADATVHRFAPAGGQAIGIAMYVTDENTIGNGVAAVIDAFSSVDILISNAGIRIVHPIGDLTVHRDSPSFGIRLQEQSLWTSSGCR